MDNYQTHLRCQRLLQGENHACSLKAVDRHREVEREALKRELSRMYLKNKVKVKVGSSDFGVDGPPAPGEGAGSQTSRRQ